MTDPNFTAKDDAALCEFLKIVPMPELAGQKETIWPWVLSSPTPETEAMCVYALRQMGYSVHVHWDVGEIPYCLVAWRIETGGCHEMGEGLYPVAIAANELRAVGDSNA